MKRRVASLLGALVLLTSAVMMAGCPQSAKPDIRKYKVTLKAGEHGTIAANPVLPKDGMVAQYAKLTFTATPDEGYELAGWTGAAPDNADIHKATLTVAADATITATFKKKPEIKKYKITLNQGEHGTVTVDPVLSKDGMVEQYTTLTFTATPENGYEVEWTGAAPSSADKNKATLTVTADASVTPVFKKTGNSTTPEIKKYKITLNQGEHGTVTVEPSLPADGMVEQYKTLTFTATPDNNYKLAEWVGAAPTSADKNKATLTVTADATITVKFKQKEAQRYHVVLNKGEHGTVTVDPALPADGMVEQKEMLTFTAIPDAGYEVEWSGAAPSRADKNKATLTVTADATVTATFKLKLPNSFHIALSNGAHGSVQAASALPANGMVAKDTVLTFTATPDAGYEVDTWTGATKDSADKNKATLTVTAHTTVRVTFKEKTVDPSLLEIDSDGTLTGVKDKNALVGSLEIPNTVTKIGDNAFAGCSKLMSVTMPETVTEIGGDAFRDCSKLTNVTIGSEVTHIGEGAFAGCTGLTSITIPDKVTGVNKATFYGCNGLTSVTIGSHVETIGASAFGACTGLISITIPDSVTSISELAFEGCTGLTDVTIGKGVSSIAQEALRGCQKLNTVTVDSDNATYCSEDNIVYTKDKTMLVFAAKNVSGAFTMLDTVTAIASYAFQDCTKLVSISIPDGISSIEDGTFQNCTGLISVTIGTGVTKIGRLAFAHCTNLTGITIPDSVTEIDSGAFRECATLSTVTIGTGVTAIQWDAFKNCSSLGTITIKSSVLTYISDGAFSDIKSDAQFTVKTEAVKTLLQDKCHIPEANITVNSAL